ncbi:MAG: 4Fe-4S dicluster domain-containing protein [Firmicutes bacterium]|nr:4Fe-4S dicluster domain-containing protein [Bacillota bacterium]
MSDDPKPRVEPAPPADPGRRTRSSRRAFLNTLGAGAATLLALDVLDQLAAAPAPSAPAVRAPSALPGPSAPAEADILLRMQADVRRALEKPGHLRRWTMAIDLRRCIGCHACTIACVAENKLPPGVVYRPVLEEEIGSYPNVSRRFVPRPCMQCESPPCVPVCPVGATYRRPDGIVAMNYDQCIGCRYCITACPYGARTFDFGRTYTESTPDGVPALVGRAGAEGYERAAAHEYKQRRVRRGDASPVGNVRKCHFCIHRIEAGLLPACVTTCIGRATFFGDASDPDSLIAQVIARPNVIRLKEELGTKPRVYYLM